MRVDAKKLENSRNQERIERRFPCRWTGDSIERITEALAERQRTADSPHLVAEAEVVIGCLEPVGVCDDQIP